MANTSLNFWVNPFPVLSLGGKEEMQRPVEFTTKEAGDDGCCENGGKSIFHKLSPRPQKPGSHTKQRPMSTPTNGHSFSSQNDALSLSPPSPKGSTTTTNYLTPEQFADAAAVLAQLATTPSKDNPYLNMFNNPHPKKYLEEKPPKKHLKRSVSFNHTTPSLPRHQNPLSTSFIDVSEVLATTVSLVRENNRKLDKISDEARSEGNISENDNEYWSDDAVDDPWQQEDDDEQQQHPGWDREIENEIQSLSFQLENMEHKYKEQLMGKSRLIEELEMALRKSEKETKRKRAEIDRLETQLAAARRAIDELSDSEALRAQGQTSEALRNMESELREKNKTITELNKRITVSSQQVSDSKEKERKLEVLSNQLLRYQTLEAEWKDKQTTLDVLSSQLEILKQREAELNEKDALIESLNIRLDTSQQVITELREKHAPHDLLRQLRQKEYIIDNLTQQVENIDADLKEKDDENELLAGRLAEEAKFIEKLREQNSQLGPLRARAEDAEKNISAVRKQLSEKERLLANLEQNYREVSRNAEDSKEKFRAQEKTIAALRQEVVDLRRSLTTQSSENRDKERVISTMKEETLHFRTNFQGLLNALSEKDQKIQQLDQHIESLQQQATAAAAKNLTGSAKDLKNNKNEVRLNALQKLLNTKIETCREYEKKISHLEEGFAGLKKQMDEGKTATSEKEIKIQRLVKMNRELKEEVTQLKEKMEAKEQELIIIKSRIPTPSPGSAPAASIRSSSKTPRSRVSSMYSLSDRESSSDEAKFGKGRVRKAASLSGFESPLKTRAITSTSFTSRRLSAGPKLTSTPIRTPLTRTKSSTSTSSIEDSPLKKNVELTKLAAKRDVKPRMPTLPTTVEVLKKKLPVTPKKDISPINRSAVTQRKRDMVVLTNMLSGVAPDRKNRLSILTQKRTTAAQSTSTLANKKKLIDNASSESDGDRKRPTVQSANRLRNGNNPMAQGASVRPKSSSTSAQSTSTLGKQRTALTRPLSKKPSSTA